jgi:hypothetical protein
VSEIKAKNPPANAGHLVAEGLAATQRAAARAAGAPLRATSPRPASEHATQRNVLHGMGAQLGQVKPGLFAKPDAKPPSPDRPEVKPQRSAQATEKQQWARQFSGLARQVGSGQNDIAALRSRWAGLADTKNLLQRGGDPLFGDGFAIYDEANKKLQSVYDQAHDKKITVAQAREQTAAIARELEARHIEQVKGFGDRASAGATAAGVTDRASNTIVAYVAGARTLAATRGNVKAAIVAGTAASFANQTAKDQIVARIYGQSPLAGYYDEGAQAHVAKPADGHRIFGNVLNAAFDGTVGTLLPWASAGGQVALPVAGSTGSAALSSTSTTINTTVVPSAAAALQTVVAPRAASVALNPAAVRQQLESAAVLITAFAAWESTPSFTDPGKTQYQWQRETAAQAGQDLRDILGRSGISLQKSAAEVGVEIGALFQSVKESGTDVRKAVSDYVSSLVGGSPPILPQSPTTAAKANAHPAAAEPLRSNMGENRWTHAPRPRSWNPPRQPLRPHEPREKMVGAPKEVFELTAQGIANVGAAGFAAAHNAWPHVRTRSLSADVYGEILSYLQNPKDYLTKNYNNLGPVHLPTTLDGQIRWDSKNNQLLARIPPDLHKAAMADEKANGLHGGDGKSAYWYDKKTNELMVNVVAGDKTLRIALRPQASEDPHSPNEFQALTWEPSDPNDPAGQGIPLLPGGHWTFLKGRIGPTDGWHYELSVGLDLSAASSPRRQEWIGLVDTGANAVGLYRDFINRNFATFYGIGAASSTDTRYINAQTGKADSKHSYQTLNVLQFVDRTTNLQLVLSMATKPDLNPNKSRLETLSGEAGRKRAWVAEWDVGFRWQETRPDGGTKEVIVLDEWVAGNVTFGKVKVSASVAQAMKLGSLKPGDLVDFRAYRVSESRDKAALLPLRFLMGEFEGVSLSNDGASYVLIYRLQDPSPDASKNPSHLPPALRVDSDPQGRPILRRWHPAAN